MERIAPAGDVYQAGTLSGNPLAVAAGLATLRKLDGAAYIGLASITERLAAGLREAAGDRPVQVASVPAWSPSSSAPTGRTSRARARCDTEAYGRFCRALLDRGVYPPASQFEAWFPSLAHDDADDRRTIEAAAEAFASHLARRSNLARPHGLDRHLPRRPCGAPSRRRERDLAVRPRSDEEPALGALAAAGPRAAEAPDEYMLLVEAIREGYLLHYESRG